MTSENQLLRQLAPEIDADTLRKLVLAFQDLRCGYDSGKLMYPYSLRGESTPRMRRRKNQTKAQS